MRYLFIHKEKKEYSLRALCRVLKVTRAGYYAWCRRPPSRRQLENDQLAVRIKDIFKAKEELYGSQRIYHDLKAANVPCSLKRVARIMRQSDLKAIKKRRFVITTDSNHDLPIEENVLDRDFKADAPNQKWTADITYIWTSEGWLYLGVVLDLFGRRVIGWSMDRTMERSLVLGALDMAIKNRSPMPGLICHSDRGSQYASRDYRKRLAENGFICSMSRKGNCWDNAPTESFFASLKKELVHRTRFATIEQARVSIFKWIEIWYNNNRRHSTNGY